jgi:hypothetical protein
MKWSFNYIAITNNPVHAQTLSECGIQQIMVDTEVMGKIARQGHKDTVISNHTLSDVCKLKALKLGLKIICRINPFHDKIEEELEEAIVNGADMIMIPMITSMDEYRTIVNLIDGRVEIIPLIETPYSFFKLGEILNLSTLQQIHFGLNDLCISLGMKNLFEVLLSQTFQETVKQVKFNSLCLGIGGIGDPQTNQKVSPSALLNHYMKCGANSVILSRNFFDENVDKEYIIRSLEIFEEVIRTGYNPTVEDHLVKQVYEMS